MWSCSAIGSSRRQESACSSQGVWAVARDGAEDAVVCSAARLSEAADTIKRPKLGPWLGVIDAILHEDKQRPAKQRHTPKRIFDRLKEEHQFTGVYTTVKDYVRGEQLHTREMFVALTHVPGEAQADFGEAVVVIAGVEQKAHHLVIDLTQSDDCFLMAFPAETTEAFLEAHVQAFAYFGGVPTRILYDSTKIAVARILGGEQRQNTNAYSELHLCHSCHYCRSRLSSSGTYPEVTSPIRKDPQLSIDPPASASPYSFSLR